MRDMADPVIPATGAWRADPEWDFLAYQLLRLAHAMLSDHFDDDPVDAAYNRALRREQNRRRGGKSWVLKTWNDNPERGVLWLHAQPVANAFTLGVTHPEFTADMAVTYDLDLEELDSATVTGVTGSIAKAITEARFWVDELTDFEFGEADLDEDTLVDMLAELGGLSDDDDDDDDDDDLPGRSSPGAIDHRDHVERMVSRLARLLRDDEAPELPELDQEWLQATPESLGDIVGVAVDAAMATPRDAKKFLVCLALLNAQLELIRYQSERGYKWADALLDEYQENVRDLAEAKAIDHQDLFSLAAALGHAKVPVKPELSEALMEAGPSLPGSMPPDQALNQAVRPLIDDLARNVTSPFEVMEAMGESAAVTPAELRCFMAHELALSPHPVMREAVPLMLLDNAAEVRQAAALALEQIAVPETLSPVSLRRAICMRNWIPEADRAALDQAIRKARMKGVQPAQWDPPGDLILRASSIDGSGAQSILLASRTGKTGIAAGLLLKLSFGMRDAWYHRDVPRREIASMLAGAQREMVTPEVERSYVDLAVQHGIAIGVAAGHLPDPATLEIAEAVGGADWKDRRIDAATETERLFNEFPADQRTASAIAASLRRSVGWMNNDRLWDSWFEDDAEIRDLLGSAKQQDIATASRGLLNGILNQRRDAWAERFLLTALWARAVKAGQPPPLGPGARAATWRDMVVLAHEALSGRKLSEIPIMAEIAERTVIAARAGW
jgi:hypothetical protein